MIHVDLHEPEHIIELIGQAVTVYVDPLNDDIADYMWECWDGKRRQVERKTWGELVSNIEHVEEQLRRYLVAPNAPDLVFLLEGVAVPTANGLTIMKQPKARDDMFIGMHGSSMYMDRIYAWLHQIAQYCEVQTSSCPEATAQALVAWYKSDQKESHSTMQRYMKHADFHPNPQVQGLIGLKLPGIGVSHAEMLIAKFGTVYHVLTASPKDLTAVEGIGALTAHRMLQRVGRADV